MKLLTTFTESVLQFFFPWACAACRTALEGRRDTGFCGWCWLALPRIDAVVCDACGVPLREGGNLCFACREQRSSLVIRAATVFSGGMTRAIHRFKYGGRKSLGEPFSVLMAWAWNLYPELQRAPLLLPVPLHRAAHFQRGYNQAALLAEQLAPKIGRIAVADALVRIRKTRPQARLDRKDRLVNLRHAFRVVDEYRPLLKDRSVLLIDDVATTGATLREVARVLRRAGARSVSAFVLSRDV